MLTQRLLLIKMKKIHMLFTTTLVLFLLIYFVQRTSRITDSVNNSGIQLPCREVHIFYEGDLRNKKVDGAYQRWLQNDSDGSNKINMAYYPSLNLYSSNDPVVVEKHMKQIRNAGIGVVVVSWWPEHHRRSPPLPLILKYTKKYDLKFTIHIQNYENRSISNLRRNIQMFFAKYGDHPCLYRTQVISKAQSLPVVYIHESNSIPLRQWSLLLGYSSNYTIRGTSCDALYVGLIVEEIDQYTIASSDFDGFYTGISFRNHTYASTWFNWPYIQDFVRERELIFIPTVSPGYDDRSKHSTYPYANRNSGKTYINAWARAVISRSKFVAINSFNRWLQGTQIEPAQPKVSYEDYDPEGPNQYLELTRLWVIEFANRSLYRLF